ncbi:MAG: hypothetical protein AB7N91_20430 [Candidatus Tectimicrobiota bacterium]
MTERPYGQTDDPFEDALVAELQQRGGNALYAELLERYSVPEYRDTLYLALPGKLEEMKNRGRVMYEGDLNIVHPEVRIELLA